MTRRRPPLRIVWTNRALSDLEAIGDFIAADKLIAAERWVMTLIQAVEKAAGAPRAGRRVPEIDRDDVREILQRDYRIVYRVKADRLEVLTVFEGHRQFPRDVRRQNR